MQIGVAGTWGLSLASCLVLVLLGACSSTPQRGASSAPVSTELAAARLTPAQASDVTFYAMNLVGTPYRYGGNTPDSGFDCSGLIGHVYKTTAGISLPRSVAGLQFQGSTVALAQVRAGDLVVFGPDGAATHAGIYVGEGRFVHAPSTGGEVRLDSIKSRYWAAQRTVYRRP